MMIKKASKAVFKSFSEDLWDKFNIEKGMSLNKKREYYFIYDKNKRIGSIQIDFGSTVAYLNDMIIKKSERGKGFGHFVMGFFEKSARERKCHKMRIKTCPERNPAAYHLYKKFGFKEEAVLKNDYFNKDWVILSKYIDDIKKSKSEGKDAKKGVLGAKT